MFRNGPIDDDQRHGTFVSPRFHHTVQLGVSSTIARVIGACWRKPGHRRSAPKRGTLHSAGECATLPVRGTSRQTSVGQRSIAQICYAQDAAGSNLSKNSHNSCVIIGVRVRRLAVASSDPMSGRIEGVRDRSQACDRPVECFAKPRTGRQERQR